MLLCRGIHWLRQCEQIQLQCAIHLSRIVFLAGVEFTGGRNKDLSDLVLYYLAEVVPSPK